MTTVQLVEEIVCAPVDTDPDDVAHIVMTPDGQPDANPQAYVFRARVEGFAVTALCGHAFVPTKNAIDLLPCSRCVEIYHQPGEHRDERHELPEA